MSFVRIPPRHRRLVLPSLGVVAGLLSAFAIFLTPGLGLFYGPPLLYALLVLWPWSRLPGHRFLPLPIAICLSLCGYIIALVLVLLSGDRPVGLVLAPTAWALWAAIAHGPYLLGIKGGWKILLLCIGCGAVAGASYYWLFDGAVVGSQWHRLFIPFVLWQGGMAFILSFTPPQAGAALFASPPAHRPCADGPA